MAQALEAMLQEAAGETETPPEETVAEKEVSEEKAAEEVAKEESEAAEASAEATEETAADDDGDFFAYVKEQFGEDLKEKFETPEEAVKGLLASHHLVGKRDEDAQYGKAVKALLQGREKELAAFLAGAKSEPERSKGTLPDTVEDFPDDAETWASQIREKDGVLVPADGAPADIVEKYKAYQRAVQKRLLEIAKSWPKLKTLPDTVEKTAADIQQQQWEAAEKQKVLDWENQYKSVLWVNGIKNGSLTPEGKRVEAEFERLQSENPGMRTVNAFKEATKLVLGEAKRNVKQPPKPKSTATRSEGVAIEETKYKSLEDEVEKRLDAGESFTKVMLDIKRRQASGVLK